ncbi:MAG TPA: hypothetical protein VLA09_07380, partial [Longimicrobiales bacterium]|nr:hypothetical protein [Longimicrobiales bacterium]
MTRRVRGARPEPSFAWCAFVGQGLVEVEVWDGVGLGGIEGGRLIEELDEEIALGRSASGRQGRG